MADETTHNAEKVTLTKGERETLLNALWDDGCHGFGSDHTHWPAAVESVIAARVAGLTTCTTGGPCLMKHRAVEDPDFVMPDSHIPPVSQSSDGGPA